MGHLSGPLPFSGDRPLYLSFACFTSQVLFLFKGPSSLESRHYILPLVRSASLCTSSILDVSKSFGEGRSGLSRVSTVSAFLAAETMVPQVVFFLRVFRGGFRVTWSCSRNLCYCCLILESKLCFSLCGCSQSSESIVTSL